MYDVHGTIPPADKEPLMYEQLTIPLPGDPDPGANVYAPWSALCGTDEPGPFACTRMKGHDGLHVLGTGTRVLEVWS